MGYQATSQHLAHVSIKGNKQFNLNYKVLWIHPQHVIETSDIFFSVQLKLIVMIIFFHLPCINWTVDTVYGPFS